MLTLKDINIEGQKLNNLRCVNDVILITEYFTVWKEIIKKF